MPVGILGIAVRLFVLGAVVSAIVFASFQWGKNACKAAQERANTKIRGQHAETVNDADRAATERALDSQEKNLNNEQTVDEIVRAAEAEPGSDDLCVSSDIVQRLRQLQ